MQRRKQAFGVMALAAAMAVGGTAWRAKSVSAPDRIGGLQKALSRRGLELDTESVVWLDGPPLSTWRAVAGSVPVVFRARGAGEEPNDVYLADARLTPEGVLLGVSRPFDISETSAVDEQRPVGAAGRFAYADANGSIRLIDLAGEPSAPRSGWTRLERVQAAITRLQDTGRLAGVARYSYDVLPKPEKLRLTMTSTTLKVDADGRTFDIQLDRPTDVPEWLAAKQLGETAPGALVNWAVDRVRAEVGPEVIQYIEAIAFSARDKLKTEKSDKAAAADIAADLGQQELGEATRAIPVDPDIGFPPPNLEPIISPAMKGEGVWQAKADDPFIHSLPGITAPTFVTTFIRSDKTRRTVVVFVAMWDPRVVQLNMMAGTAEPKSATGATGPGLIPREPIVLKRVAAAMNAGFQALHGEFGMMGDGVVYLPPKPYGATVAQMRDGSTGFGTWPEDPAIPGDMTSYRQNMTVLVLDGKYNPYRRTWWGGAPPGWEDKTHTVRTGICLTNENFVAYFYGADLSPDALAQAMIQARCHYGVALDMNAGHSGLEFYKVGPESELGALGRPVDWDWEREGDVPEMEGWKFRARRLIRGMGLMNFPRYIKREGRDFFYLTLRYLLPGKPIDVQGGKQGDGTWDLKGLPQHGFPYALARTEVPIGSRRARVLRIDPRMLTKDVKHATVGKDGKPGVVLRVVPAGAPSAEVLSLWLSAGAASIAPRAMVTGSLRLATADRGDSASAAIGVEEESGHVIYVEAADGAGPIAVAELDSLLERFGSSQIIPLRDPWQLALGGDTDLALRAVRLADDSVTLYRQPGPGSQRIFEGTPIVPFDKWYPLQARRIRYFKKPKET
jgi:hypothetical protein